MNSEGLQIFSIYYSKKNLYHHKSLQTNTIIPIQTGYDITKVDLNIMKDNSGDNISKYNNYFGELTCWYYIWKNYLPHHPEIKYIGFTQYRRILGLFKDPKLNKRDINDGYFISVTKREFIKLINSDFKLDEDVNIILPYQCILNTSLGERIRVRNHDGIGNDIYFDKIIKSLIKTGIAKEEIEDYFKQKQVYYKCNFVMKTEIFNDFMKWLFNFFDILEKELTNKEKTPRCFAYIAEIVIGLFFNRIKCNRGGVTHVYLYEARFYTKFIKDDYKRLIKNLRIKYMKRKFCS